ncbi:MAG TPA: response regulator [Terriglobia bacterium]|nr:response regulator [Terriglobia bacterium]
MKAARSVLLVHDEPDAFRGLEEVLHGQDLHTRRARQCAEARTTLKESGPVDLVLTDVALPDGDWKHIIGMVRELADGTPVIVMSRVASMKLYLDTQDAGAADFIVPPMAPRDLAYTLTTAMHKKSAPRVSSPTTSTRRETPNQPLAH